VAIEGWVVADMSRDADFPVGVACAPC